MNKEELNLLLDRINNPIIGKALLTTFHKLNYIKVHLITSYYIMQFIPRVIYNFRQK